jgi:hypothetical protein
MLKLTRHLFAWDPVPAYADYYERALFNHILSSQNPTNGMMCYYVPLRPGSRKNYNTPTDSFWCCTGTGIENHAKYGDSIYFHNGHELYVNQFVASELDWKSKAIKLRQETKYPEEGKTRLVISTASPAQVTLKVRRPGWAESGFELRLNGEEQKVRNQPGSWVVLDRTWKDGDVVDVSMPFSLRTESFRDNTNRLAILNGPLVLCAEVDSKKPTPAILSQDLRFERALQPVAGRPNTFTGPKELFRIAGDSQPATITLEPFYQMHGDRHYTVYWDHFTPAEWAQKEKAFAEDLRRKRELEARTVDAVNPGEEQNERDHNLKGQKMNTGPFMDRHYRDAQESGWFSWDLKVLPGQAQDLVVTYWGDDRGRTFDLLIDGHPLATQRLTGSHPGAFFDETYPLNPALTQGKEKVTVKVQASPNSFGGGVFGVRILRRP